MSRTSPLLLVIDDDPAIRELLARELSLSGYEVLTAADGLLGARYSSATGPTW